MGVTIIWLHSTHYITIIVVDIIWYIHFFLKNKSLSRATLVGIPNK